MVGTDRYSVMLSCWHPRAKLRPSFRQLVESVSSVVDAMQRQIQSWRAAADYVNAADDQQLSTGSELDVSGLAALDACRSTTV